MEWPPNSGIMSKVDVLRFGSKCLFKDVFMISSNHLLMEAPQSSFILVGAHQVLFPCCMNSFL